MMRFYKVDWRILVLSVLATISTQKCDALTRRQLKSLEKNCKKTESFQIRKRKLKGVKNICSLQSLYDYDRDKLSNRTETRLALNPYSSDTDRDKLNDYREIRVYHTNPFKPDTDGDGFSDKQEILAGTDPLDPRSHPEGDSSCKISSNPFDINGNTTSFGIPNGLIGNIDRGRTNFSQPCSSCHATDRGTNLNYQQLVDAVTGPKMRLSFPQQTFADLVAYLNRANIPSTPKPGCVLSPTPTPGSGNTPIPTATPTSLPGANCTPLPNPFDANGNTTSFNIPTGITGNISAGRTQFVQSCVSCHGDSNPPKGVNLNYPSLFAAVNGPPMYLSSLTNQQIAHLVAYVNKNNIPPTPRPDCNANSTPTPIPSPTQTPNAIARGRMVYVSACSSCHGNIPNGDLERASRTKITEAIREVDEMRHLSSLSSNQIDDLVAYLGSL